MDSHAIATEHGENELHDEAHPAYLRHHFVTVDQQRETASFGMWLFLLTEIMFFGGLFMAYLNSPTNDAVLKWLFDQVNPLLEAEGVKLE